MRRAVLSRGAVDPLVVFLLALGTRLVMIVDSPGGLSGVFGYDAGVYYAASDALIHGRLPYRDFVLLHPPGLALLLSPFAALGALAGDDVGFRVATLACSVLAATSAVLVVLTARRLGLSRAGALAGGVFLAVWFGTLTADYAPRLEGVGTFFFLLAAYLLVRGRSAAAGVAVAVAVLIKIWWILPLLLLAGWLVRTDRARAARYGIAAAATLAVVGGPFFLAAPRAMWRMVVQSQTIRANASTFLGHIRRVDVISSVSSAFPDLHGQAADAVAWVALALLVVVLGAAWRSRPTRIFVVVAAAQLALLVFEPSYLSYYSGYLTGALALCVAAAVGTTGRVTLRAVGATAVVAAAAITVISLARFGNWGISRFPDAARGRAAAADVRCVVADSPMALIELDALSRGLADGCPNWVDVSGQSHVLDISVGRETSRVNNAAWQRAILRYLLSGNATISIRSLTGLAPPAQHAIERLPVLARLGPYTLRLTDRTGHPVATR